MGKEIVPAGQTISMAIMFIIGSVLFMGTSAESGNSSWIALIFGMLLAVPLMLLYARLHLLFPGKDLYDMLHAVFGPVIGRMFSCLYIWYSLHLGSLVLRNFGEFSRTVALTATPMIAPVLVIVFLCIWAVKAGMEVIGKCAKFLLLFILAEIGIVQLLSIPKYEFHYLKPLLESGWTPVFADTFRSFLFPYGEVVVMLGAFSILPKKGSAARVLLSGLLIAGSIILLITLRNLLVLGPEILSSLYFPSYVAVSRINVGDFLTRIEGSSSIAFIAAIFIKVSLCLYVTSNGVAKVCNLKSYHSVVLQMGLIMGYMSIFIYKDILQMQYFTHYIYKFYAPPFEVLIPLLLWGVAEVLARKANRKQPSRQA